MFLRVAWFLLLVGLSCGAQTAGSSSEGTSRDDLRAIRASMERLEKGQATLILLHRIQTAQMRLSSLQEQRIQLLAQERLLEQQTAMGSRGTGHLSSDSEVLVAVQTSDGSVQTVPARDLNASASDGNPEGHLREVRQLRTTNEEEIKSLSSRIAAWENKLEEPLR